VTAESTIDLTILEQDYENEMTATQALNMDITKAAMILANATGVEKGPEEIEGASFDDDATAEMALGEVTDDDVRTPLDADTGEVVIVDETDEDVSFDDEFTIHLSDDEKTVDMPTVDEEKTRKMPARAARADKKAG